MNERLRDKIFDYFTALAWIDGFKQRTTQVPYYKALLKEAHEKMSAMLGGKLCECKGENIEECVEAFTRAQYALIKKIRSEDRCKECGLNPELNYGADPQFKKILDDDKDDILKEFEMQTAVGWLYEFKELYDRLECKEEGADEKLDECMKRTHEHIVWGDECTCGDTPDKSKCIRDYTTHLMEFTIKYLEEAEQN